MLRYMEREDVWRVERWSESNTIQDKETFGSRVVFVIASQLPVRKGERENRENNVE